MNGEIFYEGSSAWASCEDVEIGNYFVTFKIYFNRQYEGASYWDAGYDELEVDCVEIESVYEYNEELEENVEVTDENVIKSLERDITCDWDCYCN